MKSKLKNIGKSLLFFSVGAFILWLVYKDEDWDEIILAFGAINYWWIGLSFLVSLLSHISRAMRWNMLIKPLGYRPRLGNVFGAVLIMYLANLAIPRSGEVTRCGIVKQYDKVPFTKLFGTVILERMIDMLLVFSMLAIIILTQADVVMEFLKNNPSIGERIDALSQNTLLLILIGMFVLSLLYGIWRIRGRLKKYWLFSKIHGLVKNLREGILSVRKLENKGWFIFHSLFIFVCYYTMMFIFYFSYEPTSNIQLLPGLAAFVAGSFAMIAPVSGGIGAWHFMVIQTLLVFGISQEHGKIFALVAHSSMIAFLVFMGLAALIALPIYNRNSKTPRHPSDMGGGGEVKG